jgi:hypothetical protein
MHPIENIEGYSNEVRLDELDPETAVQVRDVLNAGAIIGAVKRGVEPGHYLVRSELLEFLNTVIKRELERNKDQAEAGMLMDQLEDQLKVALLPDIETNAEAVLGELVPMDEDRGFTSFLPLDEVDEDVRPVALNVLNTGATFSKVQRVAKSDSYFVHKDLYKTLARIRAREVGRGATRLELAGPRRDEARLAKQGGSITPELPRRQSLPDHTQRPTNGIAPIKNSAFFIERLTGVLGIDPESLEHLEGRTFEAAANAADAFASLLPASRHLNQRLRERDRDEQSKVNTMFESLDNHLAAGDDVSRQHLVDASQDITQNWPLIVFLPNGPYESELRDIVAELEPQSGAGLLNDDDQAMLVLARRLLQGLAGNPRRTVDDWVQLESHFKQLVRGGSQIAANADAKRTLN